MIQIPLTIRCGGHRQRATVAWFVPGDDPATWLDELARWAVPLEPLTLFPLPVSPCDSTPVGILVTSETVIQPRVSRRCQQYGRLAERLYLPVDAVLSPAMLEAEVADLLSGSDAEFVFCPGVGLIGIERRDRLRASNLLQSPVISETDWDWARPGHALCRRLVSVQPEQSLSVESILLRGRDDISTRDLTTESSSAEDSPRRGLFRRLAGTLLAVLGWPSGGRSAAKESRGKARENTGKANPLLRETEINRLMKLLNQDPDEGLRFALPLAGPDAAPDHRGLAPPANRLARQNPIFDLGRLSSGGPADCWQLSQQRFLELRSRYRELAAREISLGRHRRAAYIFAHLLNELAPAAATLEAGGHWREAAVIHRDRLKNPLGAAGCLERGGLWAEAIAAYEAAEAFEKAGDLHRAIGQPDEATAAYRRVVTGLMAQRNQLQAARLLEQKMELPDEALACLSEGCLPGSNQAAECLREMFRILANLGRHGDVLKRIAQLTADSFPDAAAAAKILAVLAETAGKYPEAEVSTAAADRTCILAGHFLPTASESDSSAILTCIERLAPNDRLLKRDCRRYRDTNWKRAVGRPRDWREPRLVWKPEPPDDGIEWIAAASHEKSRYFAGYSGAKLVVVCWPSGDLANREAVDRATTVLVSATLPASSGSPARQTVCWPISPGLVGSPVLLHPDRHGSASVLVHIVGAAEPLRPLQQSPTDVCPQTVSIGPHRAFSMRTRGVAQSPEGLTWLVEIVGSELILTTYGPGEQIMGSQSVPLPAEMVETQLTARESVPIAAGIAHLFLGVGGGVLCLQRGLNAAYVETSSRVRNLQLQPTAYPRCVLVQSDEQVALVWPGPDRNRLEIVDDRAWAAVAGFARDGRIAILDGSRLDIFGIARDHCRLQGSFSCPLPHPLAVLMAEPPDEVVVCCGNGEIYQVKLPMA